MTHKTSTKIAVSAVLFVMTAAVVTLLLTACSAQPATAEPISETIGNTLNSAHFGTLKAAATTPSRANCSDDLLDVVLLFDLTGSMDQATSRRAIVADFEPLLSKIESCGGEVAIAFVGERARPFGGRQFITPPPRGRPTIIRASTAVDPFTQETIAKTAEAARLERERALADWHRDATSQMTDFRGALTTALDLPRDRPRTNIQASLDEVEVFFNEPRRGGPYQHVLVAFTDGSDNVAHKPLRRLTAQAQIIVVNQLGAGSLGALTPLTFGDPGAAIRYVVGED